ncbi:hypothetical protein TrST_g13530 [Triparma strigata]|uniref:Uncharacterized protein n=1 Tax=Triparma strigata TaxID=1606541 RepID=A0A9W7E6J5_9STRA|nr:hypothetical protein TrST_g13530 [Triparma strigata]
MMSADDMDKTTIRVVGLTGALAAVGVFISETSSSLKAQRRRIELSESGQIVERATELEEPVEECSWVFVGVSFLLTAVSARGFSASDIEENAIGLALT